MHKGFVEPHLLLASSNPLRLIANLRDIVDVNALASIEARLNQECRLLFDLGNGHFAFAGALSRTDWRQIVSRLYYGAYNVRRAVVLRQSGAFSTDPSDHQRVDALPDDFPDVATFRILMKNLRDDRNLADYSHAAVESDLLMSADDAIQGVTKFIDHARAYLIQRGVQL